jgi:hypothetical protein
MAAKLSSGMVGLVVAVHRSGSHTFTKQACEAIRLIEGMGVDGDAHSGATVKHRSRVAIDPTQPNLRQVHLIHAELHEQLGTLGFAVAPGEMGENITTRGLDILALPAGAVLRMGPTAAIRVTGLRNPCGQLNGLAPGLMKACITQDASGNVTERRAGIMAVVISGGDIRPGDSIRVELPDGPWEPLRPV